MNGKIEITRGMAADLTMDLVTQDDYERRVAAREELRALLAAPVVERQPVSADIAHDKAYRNGMMAGFQFGISGNEKGYAVAIANFNSEIRAAKGKVPAPVSVVLPTREDFELWRDRRNAAIAGEGGSSSWYVTQAHYATWEAYGDKVKELNQ